VQYRQSPKKINKFESKAQPPIIALYRMEK